MNEIDESKFPYGYVPDHLKERVKNCRSLTVGERMELTSELSLAAWEKIGVVYDPTKPRDKTIRRVARKRDWWAHCRNSKVPKAGRGASAANSGCGRWASRVAF